MDKMQIGKPVVVIKLVQNANQIVVTAYDAGGAMVGSCVLEEGRDFQINGVDTLISGSWVAGDEWGPGQGTTTNKLRRTNNGSLLVKSTNTVTSWILFIPRREVTTYYFKFEAAANPGS